MTAHSPNPANQSDSRAALEDIGHLTQKICAIWGTDDLDTFLSRLIMDARDGARQGLPVAVATEVLFLTGVLRPGAIPVARLRVWASCC